MSGPISGFMEKQTLRRWRKAAADVEVMEAAGLKSLRSHARSLARQVDHVLHVAEGRMAMPLGGHAAIRKPLQSDWAWRPELWCGPIKPIGIASVASGTKIGRDSKIFHDCMLSELSLRQIRNQKSTDIAPFGVRLDVFRFDGSFLSLVLDLPEDSIEGLSKQHLVRLEIRIETEKKLEVFGRLNVRHGPNVEQIVREFEDSSGEYAVEFDLSPTRLNEARVEGAWVDLIFEGPEMNQIILRDVTLSRRPRAQL